MIVDKPSPLKEPSAPAKPDRTRPQSPDETPPQYPTVARKPRKIKWDDDVHMEGNLKDSPEAPPAKPPQQDKHVEPKPETAVPAGTEVARSKNQPRQSELSMQVEKGVVVDKVLDTLVTLPLRELLANSRELSNKMQDLLKVKNTPKDPLSMDGRYELLMSDEKIIGTTPEGWQIQSHYTATCQRQSEKSLINTERPVARFVNACPDATLPTSCTSGRKLYATSIALIVGAIWLRTHGPSDADPADPTPGQTIINEVRRQQQAFLNDEPTHVRPMIISSAQGTHSVRVDDRGIPYAHGTCFHNLETGLPSTQKAHVEYFLRSPELGWGLDVPLATGDEVRQAFFHPDESLPPVHDEAISAMFPIAIPESASATATTTSQVLHYNPSNSVSSSYTQTISSSSPNDLCLYCADGQPHSSRTCPAIINSLKLLRHLPPASDSPEIVTMAEQLRNKVQHSPLVRISKLNKSQHPLLEATTAEWIHHATSNLYDPTVPPSDMKSMFRTAFLRTQATTVTLPPSDTAWADISSPHPNCGRCTMQLPHLVSFCSSSIHDYSQTHPPITIWNAFAPWQIPLSPLSMVDAKYPDISSAGPTAYYSEANDQGIQVLRLPGIDKIVEIMITEWGYTPFASNNAMQLPQCAEFFRQLYQAWGYLPRIIDRATFTAV
ncbi:hypothetical protein FB451DRAFT_1164926 [Mycena latifolia]|nr:hypothetical protein FB451DRAFT_1164926 [Mycena latifolia]